MKHLRLIADDLTGALDTAAQFARERRLIPVFLNGRLPDPVQGDVAIDAATRDTDASAAVEVALRMAPVLAPAPETLSYKKVDSRLRGSPGLELAATLRAVPARYCIIAPAFPVHGRVTRGGRQYLLGEGARQPVGEDIRAMLLSQRISVALRIPGEAVPEGISLWDAESDMDLRAIASSGAALPDPVLWCGSGGLAAALAGPAPPSAPPLARPMLGVLGSDHPVTGAQVAASGPDVLMISDGDSDAAGVAQRIREKGVCLLGFNLPPALSRQEAARRIAQSIEKLVQRIPRPASLFATGGETTRAVCLSVGAERLEVLGEVAPGIPVSRIVGGRWDGVSVVSKSGAFGDEMLLLRIVELLS